MLIRLRSRDGLERIQLEDGASVTAFMLAIQQQLGVPLEQQRISRDPALLTAKDGAGISLLNDYREAPLQSLGVTHGDLLFLLYDMERQVAPAYKPGPLDSNRPFGSKVTMADIIAKQRRVERQDKATVEGVSFDRAAANAFQQYCNSALAFSIKRGGICYGTVGEDNIVRVEFVFEPPQQGSQDELLLERGTPQEAQADFLAGVLGLQKADFLAGVLGLQKVGWVFCQANKERDWIVSSGELQAMAAMQDEMGPKSVTVLVTWDANDHGGNVHFEAFQCSEQAVQLYKDGWFVPESEPSGISKMRNPKEPNVEQAVIVASKDADSVDNDWFLCACAILDHTGPLLSSFPVENRLIPQSASSLRDHLRKHSSLPYSSRLADLHLLLWLAGQPNLDQADMLAIVEAVREKAELMEGYKVIIDSIAGV
uniref:MPN domain-containing protein n=1 Tax=Tetradesmus obliquus TaxID=3088 RepID=A0A383VRV9_TETOB